MGHWEQQSPTLWVYCLEDRALLYGYVVCQRPDGPSGQAWDAFVASERGGADTRVRKSVSLEEAMRAVEQHTRGHWQSHTSSDSNSPKTHTCYTLVTPLAPRVSITKS